MKIELMISFFSISSLRTDLIKYLKKDNYANCKSDLCSFFNNKTIEEIFNLPSLIAPNDNCRYIKSRIANSNFNSGRSGGYRLYYYVDLKQNHVYLLGFYPKTGKYGREDLSDTEEKRMIQLFKTEKKATNLVQHDINKNFEEIIINEATNKLIKE